MLQRRGQLGKKLQSEGHLKKPARRMKRLFYIYVQPVQCCALIIFGKVLVRVQGAL